MIALMVEGVVKAKPLIPFSPFWRYRNIHWFLNYCLMAVMLDYLQEWIEMRTSRIFAPSRRPETVVVQIVTVSIGPGFVSGFVETGSPLFAYSVAQNVL